MDVVGRLTESVARFSAGGGLTGTGAALLRRASGFTWAWLLGLETGGGGGVVGLAAGLGLFTALRGMGGFKLADS